MRKSSTSIQLTLTSTTGTGGFGSAATNSSPFGQPQKPLFGASTTTTSGGGLFGGGTATAGSSTGFGGFGNTNNNSSGNSLFGTTSKPAFGSSNTGGSLFGGGNTQNTGFGANNNQQTGAFGAPISSALGVNNAECQGTGNTPFTAYTEKEGTGAMTNHFQSISFMQPYKNFSFEVSTPRYYTKSIAYILTYTRNYETWTTIKDGDLAMVVGKLARSVIPILEVGSERKTIIPALISQEATQEVDFSASPLPRLLHLGPASQHRQVSVLAEAYLVHSRTNQLQLAFSDLQRLLSRARVSLALLGILLADLAARITPSEPEEGACLRATTNSSSSSRSLDSPLVIQLPRADLDKATMPLALTPPTTVLVVAFSATKRLKTILPLGKRSNSLRLNPIRSAPLVNRKISLRPTRILHSVLSANRNSKTRSLGVLSVASSRPPTTPEEAFSETLARTTASNSPLGEACLEIPPTISPRARCLHQSQQLPVGACLRTRVLPIPTQVAGFSGIWEIITPIKPSKIKVEGCLEITRVSKSLEVFLEIIPILEVASLVIWTTTIPSNNKEAALYSETINSSSKVVVFSATPQTTTTTTARAPASSHHSSRPSSSPMFLHPHLRSTPL